MAFDRKATGALATVPAVETLAKIGLVDKDRAYDRLRPLLRDAESRGGRQGAIGHLFRESAEGGAHAGDPVQRALDEMDRFGIEKTIIEVSDENVDAHRALLEHPDRFAGEYECDPNQGMQALRSIERMKRDFDIKAVSVFPAGTFPPVPFGGRMMYPVFAKCVEIDVPICVPLGVPGPRVPMAPQAVDQLDEVCWAFPELRIVTRHGCEPWTELAVKLMLKYPGLHFSTSAYLPRYYPRPVIDYANTRGRDKLIFSGYLPVGNDYGRVFEQLGELGLDEEVWEPFLRGNALRVFRLGD